MGIQLLGFLYPGAKLKNIYLNLNLVRLRKEKHRLWGMIYYNLQGLHPQGRTGKAEGAYTAASTAIG